MIEVRDMQPGDLMEAIEFGVAQKERTVYRGLPESKPAIAYAFRRAMASKNEACFVAIEDGRLVGFILLNVVPYWWADPRTGPRYATDLALLSAGRGGGTALLKQAIEWARPIPRVAEFTSLHSSGRHGETIRAVYEQAGMKPLGGAYWIDFRKEKDRE